MDNKEIIFGIHPVIEALQSGQEIDRIFAEKELKSERIGELFGLCRQLRVPIVRVPLEKLNRMTTKNHQGVAAFISSVSFASLDNVIAMAFAEGRNPFILVLDSITDVGNFGAIVRTAECAGFDAVVVPETSSARLGGDAFKASAGALSYLPVCREKSIYYALKSLKNNGLQIIACTEKAQQNLYDTDFTDTPLALVVGSEDMGISTDCLKLADKMIKIPMFGKMGSLNVSVAAGVVLYEVVRQNKKIK